MNFDIETALKTNAEQIESKLSSFFCKGDSDLDVIENAQKYSLLGGGKRIRAFLVRAVCRTFGGDDNAALSSACAIEMIHAYSLIHDDLPCMDDDDYRRGKLTNHKVFGEATAVLAGDALLTSAFGVVADSATLLPDAKLRSVSLLSRAAGDMGMIGGQILDLAAEKSTDVELARLLKIHSLKTGALIRASVKLGCFAAGLDENDERTAAVDRYAEKIGLAFQVIDDILDEIGDQATLGKKTGSDKQSDKMTFMKFYTVEQAKVYAYELTTKAIAEIEAYDRDGVLGALALYLWNRTY